MCFLQAEKFSLFLLLCRYTNNQQCFQHMWWTQTSASSASSFFDRVVIMLTARTRSVTSKATWHFDLAFFTVTPSCKIVVIAKHRPLSLKWCLTCAPVPHTVVCFLVQSHVTANSSCLMHLKKKTKKKWKPNPSFFTVHLISCII